MIITVLADFYHLSLGNIAVQYQSQSRSNSPQLPVHPDSELASKLTLGEQEADVAGRKVFSMRETATNQSGQIGKVILASDNSSCWVGGTSADGTYVQPHNRDASGNLELAKPNLDIKIKEKAELVRLLELSPSPDPAVFHRKGFSGRYLVQTESDGTLSVFYTGGEHVTGTHCPRQTFHHGQWDPKRTASNAIVAQRNKEQQAETARREEAILPRVTSEGTELPGIGESVVVKTPDRPTAWVPVVGEIPLPEVKVDLMVPPVFTDITKLGQPGSLQFDRNMPIGDYHISPHEERERRLLGSVSETAGTVLTDEDRQKLDERYGGEPIETTDRQARELFNDTLELVNDRAAEGSYISTASDALRKKLGLPEGTTVLIARSGEVGFSEEQLHDPFDKAFGSTIRIRGFDGPAAVPGDVVVLSAFRDKQTSPLFMRMSIVNGGSSNRERWSVTQHDATFRGQPERYIEWSIDRNPDEKVVPFTEWLEQNQQWFAEGSRHAEHMEAAFVKKDETIEAVRQRHIREEAARKQRLEAAQVQSEVFGAVSDSHYRMQYKGTTVVEYFRTDAAFSAPDTRTGTFTVQPDANRHITLSREGQADKELTIDSYAQIQKLSPEQREILQYVVTSPYENNPSKTIKNMLDLFPADVYKPGSVAGLFYNPQWYKRNLSDQLLPLYREQKTPASQRAFLSKLYRELSSRSSITEDSVSEITRAMR